ncbi:MAG: sugar phosphate isomerase/epimerase [Gemmatimonadetes bacterium]|nr:sugar phosphate isomerase/epimerase [Gemmatimonadota bacterium]
MTTNRRDFLRAAGTSLGAAALLPGANRIVAWPPGARLDDGVVQPDLRARDGARDRLATFGLELYTVRTLMAQSVERTLAQVAEAGYGEVEFAGYFDRTPAQLVSSLKANGLVAPSVHVDLADIRGPGFLKVIETAVAIGHRYVVVAWLPAEDRASVDAYARVADALVRASEVAKPAGVRVGFHNHDMELAPVGGTTGLDVMLSATAGTDVSFQMDLYWATRAGADPLDFFARYPKRFTQVHLKDSGGPPAHQMLDVGRGVIDWTAIFQHRHEAGIEHCYVEHDEPADPLASIRASAAYLKALTF